MRETKKITKQDINKAFTELRQYGWQVYGFNDRRHSTGGAKGFPDYMMMRDDNCILFFEVKLYYDKITTPEQYNFLKTNNTGAFIFIATEKNYTQIVDFLLAWNSETYFGLLETKRLYLEDYEKRVARKL